MRRTFNEIKDSQFIAVIFVELFALQHWICLRNKKLIVLDREKTSDRIL
jgi:hypothetical protein